MAAKRIAYDYEAREALRRGVKLLAHAVPGQGTELWKEILQWQPRR